MKVKPLTARLLLMTVPAVLPLLLLVPSYVRDPGTPFAMLVWLYAVDELWLAVFLRSMILGHLRRRASCLPLMTPGEKHADLMLRTGMFLVPLTVVIAFVVMGRTHVSLICLTAGSVLLPVLVMLHQSIRFRQVRNAAALRKGGIA